MKSKSILRKALSVFTAMAMSFSFMTFSAVEVNAEDPVCICTAKCTTEENKNTECPVCNANYSACEYIPTSGNCGAEGNGENVIWNFDTATGTLTISGTGAMADYTSTTFPWYACKDDIKKIIIGYGVTRIGTEAFYDCLNAEEVVFERNENGESSVTSIGNYAFRYIIELNNIVVPASVETIGDYAFKACENLTTVTFEEGSMLTSIGKQCFYGDPSLKECIIPSKVTSIGDYTFRSSTSLKRFYYPAGVNFGTRVFYNDYDLEYFGKYTVNENDKTCSISYIGVGQNGEDYTPDENAEITASEIVIPEKIDGYKVTSVEIGETTVNIFPENFEAPHTTTKLSDITALEGWEYEAETDEIPAGSSVEITASYNLSETQKLTRKITVSRTACKDEDRDGLCDYGCGKRFSYSSSSSSSSGESPNIEGKNGKKGWSAISDVIEDTKEGEKVVIDMNDATEIPRNILSEIKGKDITIVLNMDNGFIWTINGKDVENPEAIDMGVKKGTRIPMSVINAVTGEREYIEITLSHNGDFGFKAVLTVDMGKNNKGNFANLYYYNKFEEETEIVSSDEIDENGKADLTFTHASEYVIVIDDTDHTDLSAGESIKVEEIVLL